MQGARIARLQKLILQELTPALRELRDPELSGFLTLTEVRIAPDLKNATVYYSILGSASERAGTARALARSAGKVRRTLAGRLHLRTVPNLIFDYDPTPEKADRIDRILGRLEREKEEHGPSTGTPEGPGGDPES